MLQPELRPPAWMLLRKQLHSTGVFIRRNSLGGHCSWLNQWRDQGRGMHCCTQGNTPNMRTPGRAGDDGPADWSSSCHPVRRPLAAEHYTPLAWACACLAT